ncbi:MAG: 4-hydroxybenzoate octaprenyltransferase [Alphaproteobacteria bacterium]|nr:4-hydroxybenzoate octaprenyltransferase [Alphaproteobacteria bacterium]
MSTPPENNGQTEELRPADARPDNWVDKWAPRPARPYLRLMRLDRPVGAWLLLWPCWWAVALATACETCGEPQLPSWRLLLAFAAGALIMRAAGCVINDLWDRKIDAKVERTAGRPIASGAVSVPQALMVLAGLLLAGLIVLLQFNTITILMGLLAVPLVIVYPLAKRVTYWPQLVLGLTFNWGAFLGWTAVKGGWPGWPSLLLYLGGVFWTLGYDTIYGHMDKRDDVKAGVKSAALALGERTKPFFWIVYPAALVLWGLAGWRADLGPLFYAGLGLAGVHFAWQILSVDLDDPPSCLRRFKSNIRFGAIIFLAIFAGYYVTI